MICRIPMTAAEFLAQAWKVLELGDRNGGSELDRVGGDAFLVAARMHADEQDHRGRLLANNRARELGWIL